MSLITDVDDKRLDFDTLCPQCGPRPALDEDGVCASCGCDAQGMGVDVVMQSLRAALYRESETRKELEVVRERSVMLWKELQEERSINMAPPSDVIWCDEDGKEYRLWWDSGDPSVGINPGWESEDLQDLRNEIADLEREYPNWRGKFESLAKAVNWHTTSQGKVIASLRARLALADRVVEAADALPSEHKSMSLKMALKQLKEG